MEDTHALETPASVDGDGPATAIVGWYELAVLLIGWIGVACALAMTFSAFEVVPIVLGASAATIATVGVLGVRPGRPRLAVWAVVVGAVAVLLRAEQYRNLEGGQDQGLYVNMASALARWGSLEFPDELRRQLSPVARAVYDQTSVAAVPIIDDARSLLTIEFYPLHPAFMAVFQRFLGDYGAQVSLIVFALLGIAGGWKLATEIDGRPRVAWTFAILLACNPALVFFSKFPVTEVVAFAFLVNGMLYLIRAVRCDVVAERRLAQLLTLLCFSGLFYTRWQFFLYVPFFAILLGACLLPRWPLEKRRRLAVTVLMVFASFALSMVFYRELQPTLYAPMWETITDLAPPPALSIAAGVVAVLIVLGIRRVIASEWSARQRVEQRAVRALSVLSPWFVVVALAASLVSIVELYRTGQMPPWGYSVPKGIDPFLFRYSVLYRLMLFASPFALGLVVAGPFVLRTRSMMVQLLAAFVALSWAGILLRPYTPYLYYYGRYLVVDMLPGVLLLASIILADIGRRFRRKIAAVLTVCIVAYSLVFSGLQLGHAESEDPRFFDDMAAVIHPEDVVVFPYMPQQVVAALRITYGRSVFVLAASEANQAIDVDVLAELSALASSRGGRLLYATQQGTASPGGPPLSTTVFTDSFMTNTDHFRNDGLAYPRAPRRLLLPTKWLSYDVMWDVFDISGGRFLEPCGGSLDMARDGGMPYGMTGFSQPEPHGRWTDGDDASFECLVTGSRPTAIEVTMSGFVAPTVPRQRVRLAVDGGPPLEVTLDVEHDETTVAVPVPPGEEPLIRLDLELLDATSPTEAGLGADARELGVSVSAITFVD